MSSPPFQSYQPDWSRIQQQLRSPAVALIVTGSFNALLAVIVLLSGVARIVNGLPDTNMSGDAERLGYVVGTIAGYGSGVLSLFVSPVIIAGAVGMLRGKNLGLARAAAILAIIPLTSCCCIAGIPVGIWTLIVLKKPEVQSYFYSQAAPGARPPYR